MSNLFGNIFGQGWAGNPHASPPPGGSAGLAAQPLTGQLGYGIGQNPYQQMNNQMAAQQAIMRQYAQQYAPKRWRIDGVDMDFDEFVNTLFPEDCAEKSYLILKFKKEDQ